MAVKTIEKLTDKQIAKFPKYVERWTNVGLCTDPADRPRAEAGIGETYKAANLATPRVVWCDSPLSQGITRAIVMDKKILPASVRASVGDSVGASVRASVWASVRDSVGASVWASGYGQHDAGWIAFYAFFREQCELKSQTEKLTGLTELCQSANWFLPHKNLCWISDRHNILKRNERGRLHCEDGPALAYRDGWQLWYLRGVAVDEQIVMQPQMQTIEQIRGEQNEEVKRLRIERLGWDRYLVAINAKQINSRRNDIEGTKEALYQADGHCVLVCACPSTAKTFALECPPEIGTCEQAQSYLSSGLSSRIISAA